MPNRKGDNNTGYLLAEMMLKNNFKAVAVFCAILLLCVIIFSLSGIYVSKSLNSAIQNVAEQNTKLMEAFITSGIEVMDDTVTYNIKQNKGGNSGANSQEKNQNTSTNSINIGK